MANENMNNNLIQMYKEMYPDITASQWNSKTRNLMTYGFDLQSYLQYGEQIGWKCEVCGKSLLAIGVLAQRLLVVNVDHDHNTGKFRGFLCNKHNVALGNIIDNPVVAFAMIVYLNRALHLGVKQPPFPPNLAELQRRDIRNENDTRLFDKKRDKKRKMDLDFDFVVDDDDERPKKKRRKCAPQKQQQVPPPPPPPPPPPSSAMHQAAKIRQWKKRVEEERRFKVQQQIEVVKQELKRREVLYFKQHKAEK